MSLKQLDNYGPFEKKNIQKIFEIGYEAPKTLLDENPELVERLRA
jgi:hypothetical protein